MRLAVEWHEVVAEQDLPVLDEAQEWPDVFARLRGEIDRIASVRTPMSTTW